MLIKYKNIIIGAGPSGLSCALNLKNMKEDNLLVLERCIFPRDKCCAGYIASKTIKAYKELGLDIDDCHYNLIDDFNIFYNNNKRQNIKNRFLFTNKMINRIELDYNFYKLAKEKGIEIWEDIKIIDLDIKKKIISLEDGRLLSFDNLIFADGTMGLGRKYQKKKYKMNIAMQYVFKEKMNDKIDIHFGIAKKGYGWVSSYQGIVNVGICDKYDENINYRLLFEEYLKKININKKADTLYSSFTPRWVNDPIIDDYIYYVGDALGACDPMTLSGLRYGLESGKIAAKAIIKEDNNILKRYAFILKWRFLFMRILQKIFYFKIIQFLVFNVGCRYFGGIISYIFNNFFVNKK